MSDPSARTPHPAPRSPTSGPRFPWHAFWERCGDPVFLLDPRGRLVYANPAWERFTGHGRDAVHKLTCTRRRRAALTPGHRRLQPLARTLAPPRGVWDGAAREVVRPVPGADRGPPWWLVRFEPFAADGAVQGVLGRLSLLDAPVAGRPPALGEAAATLRHGLAAADPWERVEPRTPAVERLLAQADLAAGLAAPVTVVGGPGTGKRALARRIHRRGPRALLPFVALDCAALPDDALEPVLHGPFGFGGGDGGTLYLANVERLPGRFVDDLLDHLDTAGPLGPRVIAGCGQPLDTATPLGHRLNLFVLTAPPLREQLADLPTVAAWLVRDAAASLGRVAHLAADAADCLREYPWPGNFRELRGVLRGAVARQPGERVELADLPFPVRLAAGREVLPGPGGQPLPPLDTLLEAVERRLIALALEQAGGNRSKAAEALGVWRPRLLRRLDALGLGGDG